ncbi:MAG TPA: hypothetical protein VLA14_14580 [Polyangia bacterium]|nr:hypothetical protein [Polyangia bacterium]
MGRAQSSENDPRAAREKSPEEADGPGAPWDATTWVLGVTLVALATGLRLAWVLTVPTVPVSDFAMYRESANYLSEFRRLDPGFIYMPGFVALLAWIKDQGGDLLAQKMPGVVFGGLGAAGLFALTLGLFERRRVAVIATLAYALWPAGVAMSSVVGTDVPAAALVTVALGLLAAVGPARPWRAALLFGVVMGLAAWVRAVALPLTALSLGYWLARRAPLGPSAPSHDPARSARPRPPALALTGVAVAATLLVLLPWGLRHVRQSGHLYFTDDHGGITALIGANPNSEGAYTRALNQMFRDLTGRGVLDEPHREVDHDAYALARDWTRFEPAYALGLSAKRAERLFDSERYLLYWSIFRPGVLVGPRGAWFAARRETISAAADAFGVAIALLALAGVALATARRRWPALALVPFQLALAATYVIFFAEPRYRFPVELLAFPFVAFALVEGGGLFGALARRAWRRARLAGLRLALAAVFALGVTRAWPALLDAGAALRARHRWAVAVWRVDGGARVAKWRAAGARGPSSLVEGGAGGVRLGAVPARATNVTIDLADALAAGTYRLSLDATAAAPAHLRLAAATGAPVAEIDLPANTTVPIVTVVVHAGGPLHLAATLSSGVETSAVLSDARLDRESAPRD